MRRAGTRAAARHTALTPERPSSLARVANLGLMLGSGGVAAAGCAIVLYLTSAMY